MVSAALGVPVAGIDLPALLPAGGVAALFVGFASYVLRTIVLDRREYRSRREEYLEEIRAAAARTDVERTRADAAQGMVDAERALRRDAENLAARAVAELEASRAQIRWYASEHARLTAVTDQQPPGEPR